MINLLDLNKYKKGLKPVTTAELFSRPGEFHPEGLYSEIIFGPEESAERKKTFSYINLNARVIHPTAYLILKQLDAKIEKFISAQETFSLEKGVLTINPTGVTGMSEFIKMLPDIKFRGGSEARDGFIKKIKESYENDSLFIDVIPVIPPSQRPAYADEKGQWVIDKINDYYVAIIRRSLQIKTIAKTGALYDLLNYELQRSVIEHDNFIRALIQKKRGLIRSQILGKRTDFSGRAVITPGPSLKANEIGLPMRLAVELFEPFIIHKLFNSGTVDPRKLDVEIKNFTGLNLSIDSVKSVLKAIKSNDQVPTSLYDLFFDITETAILGRAVLAKRDPALIATSVRAFKPILVRGNTIQLSSLTVGGFNADFDGDCSMISITYGVNDINKKCHIKDFLQNEKFILLEKIEKSNGIIVTKYKPEEKLYIQAINPEDGTIDNKRITEYSKHENIEMFKVHDKKNRFEDFWTSYDHSMIVYDETDDTIKKISPRELIENPNGKFLIRKVNNE